MKKICFCVVCLILWGTGSLSAAIGTITVTDMVGREVAVPFDPKRIVCIGPGTLRLIVYLQAESKVVGVEEIEKMNPRGRPYWLAHPELWDLPHCGPGGPVSINKKPDLEAILSVAPQIIFVTYMKASLAGEVQQTLGIPVVVLSYGAFATFDETVYDSLRLAGKILNRSKRADNVITYIESMRKDLAQRTGNVPENKKPSVYVGGIGYRGAHGIGSTEQRYAPFEWVHADNVANPLKASAGTHVFVDKEMLLKLNPDVIFIDGGGYALVVKDYVKNISFYQALKAFSNQKVYTLHPFNWYVTNIGTVLADAVAVGKLLHADRFEEVDPESMADEIYTFLVGKPVYRQMKNDYGPIGGKAPFLMN
jgi:iron complex transport system substrate-binding protein